jgi:ATP-dependent Clp protease ATP-binding subunit ClpC
MTAPLPGPLSRARWIIRTQLAALSPGRKHTPGIHTHATGFIPFTGPASESVAFAARQAWRDGYRHWGPGHLLLALASQDDSVAARALDRLGISRELLRQQAGQITGHAQPTASPQPHPPEAVIQAVLADAAARCDEHIGTEHLLPALFRASDPAASQVLAGLGAGEREIRGAITVVLAESGPERSA